MQFCKEYTINALKRKKKLIGKINEDKQRTNKVKDNKKLKKNKNRQKVEKPQKI